MVLGTWDQAKGDTEISDVPVPDDVQYDEDMGVVHDAPGLDSCGVVATCGTKAACKPTVNSGAWDWNWRPKAHLNKAAVAIADCFMSNQVTSTTDVIIYVLWLLSSALLYSEIWQFEFLGP